MKAIEINGQIKTYTTIPESYGNVLGGFNLLSDNELKNYGFYDIITPEYDIRIEGVGELYFNKENEVFTQDVTDLPFNESLTEMKNTSINQFKNSVNQELKITDWYITRKSEKDTDIPSAISTHRDAVRSKQDSMCTAITNASDTPALETLYTYTEQEDGSSTRPLGELPTL